MQHFQALLRIDTSDPPCNEQQAAEYLKGVLEKEGIPLNTFALEAHRPIFEVPLILLVNEARHRVEALA